MDVESKVTRSEAIFVDQINKLLKNKQEIETYQRRNFTSSKSPTKSMKV